ncbi:MAG: carboxylic acid reductase [Acidimicrobiia bacterium]
MKLPRYARRVLDMAKTDPELQALMPDAEVLASVTARGQLFEQTIDAALAGYDERPALGERDVEVTIDASTGRAVRSYPRSFHTVTYGELRRRARALAELWRRHPIHRVDKDEFVAILGFAGIDYVTVGIAVAFARATEVPLQTTLAGHDLEGIIVDTAPVAIAATMSDLVQAAQYAGRYPNIRSIIAFDYDERFDDDRDQLAAARAELESNGSTAQLALLHDLIAQGDCDAYTPYPVEESSKDRLAVLVHSSGSTGSPKGAMFPDRLASTQFGMVGRVPVPVVRLCFAPLNHSMGRAQVQTTLARGGTCYFTARTDMSTLFEDMQITRPTEYSLFPRILDMVHRHFLTEMARRTADGTDPEQVRAEVMAEMRADYMGDRIVTIVTSSAPLTKEVEHFIRELYPDVAFVETYGNTEANGGVTVRNRVQRPPVIDYRLSDVPELGYFVTDKPYPRGELHVKTVDGVPGYFKNPAATEKLLTEDGYIRTGDIMEEHGPDHLVFIDRRNDVLKLAQGEFVTCGAVGTTFENGSELILQIYVYGNGARSYLLAIVVPNMVLVEARLGVDPSPEAIKALMRSELKRVGTEANLRSFEIPRDFIVEMEPFSHANGLLSSIEKKMRPNLQRRYGERLEQLYADLERKQNDDLMSLRDTSSNMSVPEKVAKVLEVTLGVTDVDSSLPYAFAQLGGDSLGAAAFSSLLNDIFDVVIPVSAILSPTGSIAKWSAQIERARAVSEGAAAAPTFTSVHGRGARQINASDLTLEKFIGADVLASAATALPSAETRHVFLTGSTGFLGRFLAIEWLERMSAVGGTVSCLVRASNDSAGLARLRDALSGDAALEERFERLRPHLEIVVGDMAEPRLGIGDATYARLADSVDRIVHPGALVNHILDYEHLFGPNVAGTADLIALAITGRQKRFDFVSSLAVMSLVDRSAGYDEASPLQPSVDLSDAYNIGYAASKWAGEILLQRAHERFGLPVNIFRGDMMLPHSSYRGQINVPDVFIRMLFSLITTGLAPESFYQPGPDGARARAHYDGLPVDFVAASVADLGEQIHDGYRVYNTINHHDDGVSLDSLVDWIISAGYPIERMASHQTWIEQFELRLKALPEQQRQFSSVLVLDPWRRQYKASWRNAGSGNFIAAVAAAPCGPEVPHITEAYIHKCVADLVAHDMLPTPSGV